jgi:hypothetical protein
MEKDPTPLLMDVRILIRAAPSVKGYFPYLEREMHFACSRRLKKSSAFPEWSRREERASVPKRQTKSGRHLRRPLF